MSKPGQAKHVATMLERRQDLQREEEEIRRENDRLRNDCSIRDTMIANRQERIRALQGEAELLGSANENTEELIIANKKRLQDKQAELGAMDKEIQLGKDIHDADDTVLHFPTMAVPAIRNHFGIQSEEDIDGITAEETFEILHDFDIKGMQEHEDYDGPEKYHFRKDGTEDTDHRKSIIAKALKINWWPKSKSKKAAAQGKPATASDANATAAPADKKRSWDELTVDEGKKSADEQFSGEEDGDFQQMTACLLNPKVKKHKLG